MVGFCKKHTLPIDRFCILYGIAELAGDNITFFTYFCNLIVQQTMELQHAGLEEYG